LKERETHSFGKAKLITNSLHWENKRTSTVRERERRVTLGIMGDPALKPLSKIVLLMTRQGEGGLNPPLNTAVSRAAQHAVFPVEFPQFLCKFRLMIPGPLFGLVLATIPFAYT